MKRMLTAAAALSILAGPAVSLAQEHHDERGGGERSAPAARPPVTGPKGGYHAPSQGAPAGGDRPQGVAPAYQAQGRPAYQGGPGYQGQPGYRGGAGYQGQPGYRGGAGDQGQPGYRGGAGYQGQPGYRGGTGYQAQPGYRGGAGYQGQPGYRGAPGGPRPGAQAFAFGDRTFYRYHAAPYAFPGGYGRWGDHDWRRGEFLPSVFFLPNYFISDYWAYGLWAPDYGYQWIRVGADALLINLATGQVVDVVPGVYYW